MAFISAAELVKGVSDGKLAARVTAGSETFGALFVADTGKVSEASVAGAGGKVEGAGGKAEGAGGKFDGGKEADVTLGVLLLTGSKEDGNSGKLEDPVGKERLKLGYCIDCCTDEGIDKPGGGLSKDCWCK